ncbi:MAG: hypothetical protein K2G03_00775 [Bacilli bacterium]|nr:hypothetical protein [Bacilli bacterium]
MEWDTDYLIPGMVLKTDLLQENGVDTAPLMPGGKVITVEDIARLKRHKIEKIVIEEYNETFFDLFREFASSTLKTYNVSSISHIARIYEYIVNRTRDFKFDMTEYLDEEKESMSLFKHDVDVASMAVALAAKHNKTVTADERIDIQEMAEAALLKDVGLRANFPTILKKIKSNYAPLLSKYKEIYPNLPDDVLDNFYPEFRPFYSYLILKGSKLNNTQITSILLHNEKEVGTNGPLGIEMSKQDSKLQSVKMAKILKMCQTYDLLLRRAKAENPEQPFGHINKTLDKMVASGLLDPYWKKMISLIVPLYPLGEKVELSDGTIGVVSRHNEFDMSKPYVSDLNGNEVDLYKEQLVIMGLCCEPKMSTPGMSMSAGA